MPGATRVSQDAAGGIITNTAQSSVFVNGRVWAVQGAIVASHGTGPHAAATMQGASSTVRAGGSGVCRQGDSATCGHTAGGSGDVAAG